MKWVHQVSDRTRLIIDPGPEYTKRPEVARGVPAGHTLDRRKRELVCKAVLHDVFSYKCEGPPLGGLQFPQHSNLSNTWIPRGRPNALPTARCRTTPPACGESCRCDVLSGYGRALLASGFGLGADRSVCRSVALPQVPLSPVPRSGRARTERWHRISGTPARRKEGMCLSPRSRTQNQSRTSGTVRAPKQVAAMTWQTGRTSTPAQRQTSSSACREVAHRAQAASPMHRKSRGRCRPAAPSSCGVSRIA